MSMPMPKGELELWGERLLPQVVVHTGELPVAAGHPLLAEDS